MYVDIKSKASGGDGCFSDDFEKHVLAPKEDLRISQDKLHERKLVHFGQLFMCT